MCVFVCVCECLYIGQYFLKDVKKRNSVIKKAYDMISQIRIIECLKMHKILDI